MAGTSPVIGFTQMIRMWAIRDYNNNELNMHESALLEMC